MTTDYRHAATPDKKKLSKSFMSIFASVLTAHLGGMDIDELDAMFESNAGRIGLGVGSENQQYQDVVEDFTNATSYYLAWLEQVQRDINSKEGATG